MNPHPATTRRPRQTRTQTAAAYQTIRGNERWQQGDVNSSRLMVIVTMTIAGSGANNSAGVGQALTNTRGSRSRNQVQIPEVATAGSRITTDPAEQDDGIFTKLTNKNLFGKLGKGRISYLALRLPTTTTYYYYGEGIDQEHLVTSSKRTESNCLSEGSNSAFALGRRRAHPSIHPSVHREGFLCLFLFFQKKKFFAPHHTAPGVTQQLTHFQPAPPFPPSFSQSMCVM